MKRLTTSLNRFVAAHPWIVIAVFSAITVFWTAQIPKLAIEPDVKKMFPAENPVVQYDDWVIEFFAINTSGVVLVTDDGPNGVFTPKTLAAIEFISDEMEVLDLVDGDDVISLAALDNITADQDTLEVDPFFDEAPTTQAEADAVREAALANPMMVGTLVSDDATATIISAEIIPGKDKVALYYALQDIVDRAPESSARFNIAGRPVIEGEMGQIARGDLAKMFPIVIVVVGVLLAATLRCVRGVVLPILVVLVSVLWTIGLQAWIGSPFLAVNAMVPSLLVAIGVADGIHVVHHFLVAAGMRPEATSSEITFETMEELAAPVIMTSITTAAGFFSMALSELQSMRYLGGYLAVGVLAAMIFSLTLLPAVLAILPLPARAGRAALESQNTGTGIVARVIRKLSSLVTARPFAVSAAMLGTCLVAAAGIPWIVVDASLTNNFPHGNPVRTADNEIRTRFDGSVPLEITIDARDVDAWKDPKKLRAMVAFQDDLEATGSVGESRSIADYIRRLNSVMNPEQEDGYTIPDSQALIAQYLLLYSISGEPDDFDDVIDYDYRWANIRTQVESDHTYAISEALGHVDELAHKHFDDLDVELETAGTATTMNMFMALIIESQLQSLLVGLILVTIISAVFTRSALTGLYCLVPVLVGTLLNFAALGWFNIALGVTTAITSSMGIGIGVDYAIHYVVRFRRGLAAGGDTKVATEGAMDTAGAAILYNAVVVMVGFGALSTSGFLPNRQLGALVSANMAICFIATLTLLAALMVLKPPPASAD